MNLPSVLATSGARCIGLTRSLEFVVDDRERPNPLPILPNTRQRERLSAFHRDGDEASPSSVGTSPPPSLWPLPQNGRGDVENIAFIIHGAHLSVLVHSSNAFHVADDDRRMVDDGRYVSPVAAKAFHRSPPPLM